MVAAAAAAPVIPEPTNDDNFAAAFEQLAKLGDGPIPDDLGTPAAVTPPADPAAAATPSADPAGEPIVDDLPNPEAQIAEAEAAAAAAAGKETPPAPAPAATIEDALNKLADRLQPKEPAKPAPTPATPVVTPDFSTEELAFLAAYNKEWPDVARAEAIQRRAEYKHVVQYVFAEIGKQLGPLAEVVRELSTRTHVSDLQERVEDYADVRDAVIDWIGKQPSYLQTAYNNVVSQGTADEVADLINRYRADAGVKPPQAPPAAAPAETELPSAAKQAAAKLAPVSSKRSAAVSTPSKDDFDGAFAQFAAEKT